jgi:chromate transporter
MKGIMSYHGMSKRQIYLKLFLSALSISAIAFGGGFVILSLLRKTYVEQFSWIEDKEMTDLISIAQSAPGTIAGNAAMLVGFRVASVPGALLTLFASIIPPLIIITSLIFFYTAIRDSEIVCNIMRGMQAGVATVILDLVVKMARDTLDTKNALVIPIMVAAFVASFFFKFSIIFIILIAACLGIAVSLYRSNKPEAQKK